MPTTLQDPNAQQLPLAPTPQQSVAPPPVPKAKPDPNAAPQANTNAQSGQIPLAQAPQAQALPSPTVQAPQQPVDRVKLAVDAWSSFAKAAEPYAQKAREGITSQAAGLGQLGSGQWRTALRDEDALRTRELDTQRDNLIRQATEGSIADATTAFQQQLAIAQQGLAGELGRGNLDVARSSADTARTGTLGGLGLEKERIDLAREGQTGSLDLAREQFALTKQLGLEGLSLDQARAKLDERVALGQMTLAEKDQALRELSNQQQFGIAGEQLSLAKDQFALSKQLGLEGLSLEQARAKLDEEVRRGTLTLAQQDQALRELANEQQNTRADEQLDLARDQFALTEKLGLAGLSLDQARAKLDEKVALGQLSVSERAQALNELTQSQNNTNEQARLTLAKQQLAETSRQFGLSLAQQKELATIADATQNRQLDISSEHGQNSLMVELARILGGPTGSANREVLEEVARALGIEAPTGVPRPRVDDPQGPTTTGGNGGQGTQGAAPGTPHRAGVV